MASDSADRFDSAPPRLADRLESWKEIADYLRRDVRTVQRWEKVEGLPVHRHFHERRGSPYAFRTELDSWCRTRRLQTEAQDSRAVISPGALSRSTAEPDDSASIHRPERRRWVAAAVSAGVALATVIAAVIFRSDGAVQPVLEPIRFTVNPPEGMSFASGPVLSPDGHQLVAVTQDRSGKRGLAVRALASIEARQLPGTDGASNAFWAPDAASLGFFADGKLKRLELAGGIIQSLADVGAGDSGGSWSSDGTIIFSREPSGKLYRVSAAGGPASPLPDPDQWGAETGRQPSFLPDGRHFLFYVRGADSKSAGTYVGSVNSVERTRLLDVFGNRPVYSQEGYLLFVQNRMLMAQRFDSGRLRLSGDPTPLEEQVSSFSVAGHTLAFTKPEVTELSWFDRAGRKIDSVPDSDGLGNPALSPDDTRIAANRRVSIGQGIWLVEVARRLLSRFTSSLSTQAVWSPDGHAIVFSEGGDLYRRSAAGGGEPELLLTTPDRKLPHDWSPDGRFIVYVTNDPRTQWDLWMLPLSGDRRPVPFLRTEFSEFNGQVSPDGRWIAYVSDESGSNEVFVQSFPVPGSKRRISGGGGTEPKWRRDGGELFYLAPDRSLMAVAITTGESIHVGSPTILFRTDAPAQGGRNRYAVSADGQRFLVESLIKSPASAPITVVVNWPTALRPSR